MVKGGVRLKRGEVEKEPGSWWWGAMRPQPGGMMDFGCEGGTSLSH